MASELDTISTIRLEFIDMIEVKLNVLKGLDYDGEVSDFIDTASIVMFRSMERRSDMSIGEAQEKLDQMMVDLLLQWLSTKPLDFAERFRGLVEESLKKDGLTLEQLCEDSKGFKDAQTEAVEIITDKQNPADLGSWQYSLCEQYVALRFGKIIAEFLSEIAGEVALETGEFAGDKFTELGDAIVAELVRLNDEYLDYPEVIYDVMLAEARKVFGNSIFLALMDQKAEEKLSN
ncbi:hypothetical protein IT412_01160 [Candidatus Peregrinibacteria bacterium]|nr:hypothetical protein [Candidatus Peregrinibacteria bacterium]